MSQVQKELKGLEMGKEIKGSESGGRARVNGDFKLLVEPKNDISLLQHKSILIHP